MIALSTPKKRSNNNFSCDKRAHSSRAGLKRQNLRSTKSSCGFILESSNQNLVTRLKQKVHVEKKLIFELVTRRKR